MKCVKTLVMLALQNDLLYAPLNLGPREAESRLSMLTLLSKGHEPMVFFLTEKCKRTA